MEEEGAAHSTSWLLMQRATSGIHPLFFITSVATRIQRLALVHSGCPNILTYSVSITEPLLYVRQL